jgi:hypothetical protein
MKKLSIAIDMGAKNTGVFVAKSKKDKIVEKKAFTVILDKSASSNEDPLEFIEPAMRALEHPASCPIVGTFLFSFFSSLQFRI